MPNKLKILYITNDISGPGGLERVLSIKASYLADNYDYEVHIVTLHQAHKNLFYDFSSKIQYQHLNVKGNLLIYYLNYKSGIKKMIKKIKPHIICVCDDGLKGFLFPLIIGKPCPMVYERHVSKLATEAHKKSNLKNRLISKIQYAIMDYGAKHYDAFVVLTRGNVSEWKSKNIKVISNPLSFFPEKSASLKNKKVIAVGKHCHQKGYDRLLHIWKIVTTEHPDWILEIYGASNPDHDLNDLAKNLKIKENVKFYKPDKNIKEKMFESSILVLTSRYEGFGMVLIEAMACGLPVISFDCPHGPFDIITQNEDGFLIKKNDTQAFSNALIKLIENQNLRITMGKAAKDNVKRYLPDNIVPKWDQLFKSLIKN